MPRYLVTGANGHLGRRLLKILCREHAVEALVRSERARRQLIKASGDLPGLTITLGDPGAPDVIAALASRCDAAIHLIGTIRETPRNRYADSHERPVRALIEGTQTSSVKRLVYLSILGARSDSPCECLRWRARAEAMLLDAPIPATIIRIPMVLGERDRASYALAKRASAKRAIVVRAASLEQPIYAGDVVSALANVFAHTTPRDRIYDLAGPVSLTRRALLQRAAAVFNNRLAITSVPLLLGLAVAGCMELLGANAPVTRDFLRVLDHDDCIDPLPAAAALGITLTPLDEMLQRCLSTRLDQDGTA
jgi:NADH dehydrogenase